MFYIKYYFGEHTISYPLDYYELRTYIKDRLSDWDKNSLIDFIVDNITDKDLFDIFYDDLHDYYEKDAYDMLNGD